MSCEHCGCDCQDDEWGEDSDEWEAPTPEELEERRIAAEARANTPEGRLELLLMQQLYPAELVTQVSTRPGLEHWLNTGTIYKVADGSSRTLQGLQPAGADRGAGLEGGPTDSEVVPSAAPEAE